MSARTRFLSAVLGLVLASAVQAAEPAGQVVMAVGQATATQVNGKVRALKKPDPVFSGELLATPRASYVNLRFIDGSYFLLRPETRFEVAEFAATPSDRDPPSDAPVAVATSKASFNLAKGGLRTVSGLVGKVKKEDYQVTTPVATIGIRGTRYTARLCQGDCEDYDDLVELLRLAGYELRETEIVLITHVEEGAIEIATPRESRTQPKGAIYATVPDGRIFPLARLPRVEAEELNLRVESCSADQLPASALRN